MRLRRRTIRGFRCFGAAARGHELVEFGLVPGLAETAKKFLEFLMLLFEPPQRLLTIFIEGHIAARRRALAPVPPVRARRIARLLLVMPTARAAASVIPVALKFD